MSENLALSELAKRLEKNKEEEIKQVHRIQAEKLHELSQRLNERLSSELSTIEDDMRQNLQQIEAKMSEDWEKITKQEKHLHKEIEKLQEDLKLKMIEFSMDTAEAADQIHEELNKLKRISEVKRLIYPALIGISIIFGLAAGAWSLGAYASHQLQEIEDQRSEIVKLDDIKRKLMELDGITVYSDGIRIKKKPKVFQTKDGDWVVLWKVKEN